MGSSRLLKLMAVCLISSTVPNTMALSIALDAARGVGLLPRQQICGGFDGFQQCGKDFPSEFCCSGDSTCIGFDGGAGTNSGAICCPNGNCSVISPVVCQPVLFNAALHADNPIHLTKIPQTLSKCGAGCCPPGYKCDGSTCRLIVPGSSSAVASATTTQSLSSARTSSTAATSATSNNADASDATTSPDSSNEGSEGRSPSNQFPPVAVVVGFFPGIIVGSLITFLLIICIGKRNRREKEIKDSDSLGPVRAHISDPIYQGGTDRIDFLRRNTRLKTSPSTGSFATNSPPISRVRSLFSKSPSVSREKYDPALGISHGEEMPKTPERQLKREPSTESIPILSPPEARYQYDQPGDRQTTFGDVLKAVGLNVREPMPYMGSPGMVDPRSRGVDDGQIRR